MAHLSGNVAMAGDEDDGDVNAGSAHLVLQIEAALAWHSHIENQTCGRIGTSCTQEFGRRSKHHYAQANRSHQAIQTVANCAIVIHDENNRILFLHAARPSALGSVN
jgi:hypothetical protein